MDAAKTLIRTAVRSFYSNPKQILIIDALLIHSVLHADDLNILLSTQQKEIRKLVAPLKRVHLLDTHSKVEAKVGQTRGASRDYYYIPFHPAIDAIKYRITKLTDKVKELYQPETQRKEWRCPRCKSEYDTFQVLTYVNDEGFSCEKCGTTLEETLQAKDAAGMIGHEKHSRLMDQLSKILSLMQQVDHLQVPENDFDTAWDKRKEVPRERGQHARKEYVPVPGTIKVAKAGRTGPEQIKAETLDVNLTSGEEHDEADEAGREAKRAELAKQNMLPVWHTQSTVSGVAARALQAEDTLANGIMTKKEENADEKKPATEEQDDLAAYLAEMRREREEAERKAAEEDLESDEGDEEDDFEDVMSAGAGTPLPGTTTPASSSLQPRQSPPSRNGVKREFDTDSGPSSDANTPAAATPPANDGSEREAKRVKFESGMDGKYGEHAASVAAKKEEESDDDGGDLEDAL
jgi:transcription initiation factor TFIIE subunit alpha